MSYWGARYRNPQGRVVNRLDCSVAGRPRRMVAHLTAWVVSGAVVLSAPFMGQVRAMLRSAFPGHFADVVAGSVGAAVVVAVATALVRVRDRRAGRYAAIVGAVAVAAAYSLATASGTPDVDAVERVHFVEYGVISLLFYRARRAAADLSMIALPVASGVIVGALEEWFQMVHSEPRRRSARCAPESGGDRLRARLQHRRRSPGVVFVEASAGFGDGDRTLDGGCRAHLRGLSPRRAPRLRESAIPRRRDSRRATRARNSRPRPGIAPTAGARPRRQRSSGCRAKINTWTRACGTSAGAMNRGRRTTSPPRRARTASSRGSSRR